MPIQRSLRISRTHSFDALRCAESSKRLACPLKISIVLLIPMFRRPPVIFVFFAPSRLGTVNEVSFKQHDKRELIDSKVNGFDPPSAQVVSTEVERSDFVVLHVRLVVLGAWKAHYDFGENRVATLALLTITTLPGRRSCGTATAKFSGHAFTFRSWPTVF